MKKIAVVAVRRRLESLHTGANVYLSVLMDTLREADHNIHLVFAPESAFGGLPFAVIGRAFEERVAQITWPGSMRLGRLFISLRLRVWGRFLRRLKLEIEQLAGKDVPDRIARASMPLRPSEVEATAQAIDAEHPDAIVVEYSALGPVLEHVQTMDADKAILLHDLFSLRAQTMRDSEKTADFFDLSLEDEAAWCTHANTLIYASQSERDVFAPLLPGRAHKWLAPALTPGRPIPPSGHPRAFFMGVRHSGNLDALEFLMEDIWPRVITEVPDAELCIVGEIGKFVIPKWRRLSGVRVLGIVDDLTSFGGPDTIGLAPTRLASGISIKIADYVRLDMAVIASRTALNGYGAPSCTSIVGANDGTEFAGQVVALLKSRSDRHAQAANAKRELNGFLLNTELVGSDK